jgi:hypothetical protein
VHTPASDGPRSYLDLVDRQCDFLSRELNNGVAFDWTYHVSRCLGDWSYEFPLGPCLVGAQAFLVRLLVAALPMQGARGPEPALTIDGACSSRPCRLSRPCT